MDGKVLIAMACCLALLYSTGTDASTYVRWGRTTCPENGTELVYTGFAAGSSYYDQGSGATVLCLTSEPINGEPYDGEVKGGAWIFGAEYHPDSDENFPQESEMKLNVPCAVCMTPRTSVLMIPDRNQCHGDDWIKKYDGYLSGGYHSEIAATEIVCLDGSPEAINPGPIYHNGKILFIAEYRCGSLPCEQYHTGMEITCVVCSK